MRLSQGARLGPYEILAPLGAGGMGEVYRARDPRLGRDVAVKVLPEGVATDPDRLRRFQKEARAAGALSHPNILDVHDVGAHEGRPYVVTELLEGETLRERLGGAALSPRKAVEYGVQIARGLAAAHEKRIVHRDLKPENLFLTQDGLLKILDFGLAKLRGPEEQADPSGSRTETVSRTTDPGTVLGTVGYMSPEQVRGQAVDHRSDIFSFGAVLYEMLSGRRAFQGDSGVEVLNAILKEEPAEICRGERTVSPALAQIVERCLEKGAKDRFDTAHDLALALQACSPEPEAAGSTRRRRHRARWPLLLVACLGALVAAAWLLDLGGLRRWLASGAPPGAAERQDRVMVAPFENRTGDPTLDSLGLMVADSVTRGVALSGVCQVVPAMSVVEAARAAAGSGGAPRAAATLLGFAEQAGASILVSGAYYLDGDRLRFETEVTELAGGTLLRALEPVSGPSGDPAEVIEAFRQRIMGLIAAHVEPLLGEGGALLSRVSSVPTYEAFQEYALGIDLFWTDPRQSMVHLLRAAELDPEFLSPWFPLSSHHTNARDCAAADSALRRLEQQRQRLTPWERLALKIYRALTERRLGEGQRLSLQFEELAPGDIVANWLVVLLSVQTNRPQDAVDAYARLERGPWEKHELNFLRVWFMALAQHRLGRYEEELETARGIMAHDPDPWSQPATEVRALAALGRIEELGRVLDDAATMPALPWMNPGVLLNTAASELRAHGQREASIQVADRAVDWCRRQEPGKLLVPRTLARSLYLAERWDEARALYQELARQSPEDASLLGRLGALAARRGDRGDALEISAQLEAMLAEVEPIERPCALGEHTYQRACIAALLGQPEEAVRLLRAAVSQGLPFVGILPFGSSVHTEIDLEPLRGYPPFQELMRPKG